MPVKIKPLREDLITVLVKHNLLRKLEKQVALFQSNPHYPSLHTEILEPKHLKIYSFRVDRKYRAIFVYLGKNTIEIVDINCHYND